MSYREFVRGLLDQHDVRPPLILLAFADGDRAGVVMADDDGGVSLNRGLDPVWTALVGHFAACFGEDLAARLRREDAR